MPHPSKTKGNRLEQEVTKDLRQFFPFAKTSRQASRLLDNCKIDIANVPFLIQCKSGYIDRRPKFEVLFNETKNLLKENVPPDDNLHKLPFVLVHKLNGTKGKTQPELKQVTMSYDLFLTLIEKTFNPK